MADYKSNTYTLNRKILTFTNKISRHLSHTVVCERWRQTLVPDKTSVL